MNKLTAEQRVQRAHVALMNDPKYCLFSGVFMIGKTEVKDDIPTAATNGRDTYYGREFVDKLTDEELRGLILHENKHKAFRHLTIWKSLWDDNPRLANMACDYVINLMIYDSDVEGKFVKLPEGGCFDEQYRGMDAATVFKLLKQKTGNGGGAAQAAGAGGEGFDSHDWSGSEEMTTEEKQALANEVDQALRQGGILAGKMNGNIPREVTDALESKMDWREVLREYITSTCTGGDDSTWRRPSRRWVSQDIYMPSTISERVGRIVIANDMSGSMWDMLPRILGEVKAICENVRPEGIDILYWDTQVCQHEKYDGDEISNILQTTKPQGGGGTDASCIPAYIRDKKIDAQCVIVITDGHVFGWGDNWPCPVLWAITTRGITAPVGKSVTIID
jgi:predicted metal-dependent peptidase